MAVHSDVGQCPYCKGARISPASRQRPLPAVEPGSLRDRFRCSACGREWWVVYRFSHKEAVDGTRLY